MAIYHQHLPKWVMLVVMVPPLLMVVVIVVVALWHSGGGPSRGEPEGYDRERGGGQKGIRPATWSPLGGGDDG